MGVLKMCPKFEKHSDPIITDISRKDLSSNVSALEAQKQHFSRLLLQPWKGHKNLL